MKCRVKSTVGMQLQVQPWCLKFSVDGEFIKYVVPRTCIFITTELDIFVLSLIHIIIPYFIIIIFLYILILLCKASPSFVV